MIERIRTVDGRHLVVWALRLAWIALPFAAGPALGAALDEASRPVQVLASVALWAGWSLCVLALLVPRPLGLTLVRIAAPAAAVVAVGAAVSGNASAVALGAVALVLTLSMAPAVGWVFVNGASYGAERRHLLRPPGPLLIGPLYAAWAAVVVGVAAGPLLLATRQWVLGGAALAAGLPVAAVATQALHRLSRRWLVFVPAGLVMHDRFSLMDPVLFGRRVIARLGPAPAATDAVDLTQRSPGLALQLDLEEDVEVVLVTRAGRRRQGQVRPVRRLLVTPTRPGAVLADARRRRIRTR